MNKTLQKLILKAEQRNQIYKDLKEKKISLLEAELKISEV